MKREFVIQERQLDGVLVLQLSGELLVGDPSQALRSYMEKVLRDGAKRILVNMTGVTYLDSTGVGALLAAKTSAVKGGCELKVCCVQPMISRLLKQLRLASILDVHEEEVTAVATFAR